MIGILKCQSRINYIIKKYHDNIFELSYLKNLEHTIINETLLSQRGVYDKKYGLIPTLRGFAKYLFSISEKMSVDEILMNVSDILAEHVIDELETIDNNIEKAKNKKQVLIDITPHQTLSIEAAAATVEDDKKEMTFNDLFPSIEDKEMVMKMLVALKIINSEDKYLLGTKTGIIRVFIDVMKEEGYFNDIHRKPILRIFTPVILGRRIEVINEPANFNVIKNRILIKLKELRK